MLSVLVDTVSLVHCSVNTNLPPLLVRPKLTLYVNKGSDACE